MRDGHDGTWVAHPALVPVALDIFNAGMRTPNQVRNSMPEMSSPGCLPIAGSTLWAPGCLPVFKYLLRCAQHR